MGVSGIILTVTGILKPALLKIFPYQLLRSLKGRMIKNSYRKLSKIKLQPFERERYPDGINLIGNIKAETGLGQSCRLVANELEHCSFPFSVYQYHQLGLMSNKDDSFDYKIGKELPYNINLIHINPHELGLAFFQLPPSVWNRRYNIGFWLWELEEFPDEWRPCFHVLDEIWTPSEFISRGLRKKTELPVITIPYHVSVKIDKAYKRENFHLPEDIFLFLMMYDRASMSERKNPRAVIEAYKRAFFKNENGICCWEKKVGLVIKINNCTAAEIDSLKAEMGDFSSGEQASVYFITEVLNRDQVNSLLKCVDAVVSLHRAEGFGLVLAEAMLLGTPVIATNWSSNTEFMTKETACLVDAKIVELETDVGLFKKGNRWAEADVKQAAGYMRKLFEDREYGGSMAEKAEECVKEQLGLERAAKEISKRLQTIYRKAES